MTHVDDPPRGPGGDRQRCGRLHARCRRQRHGHLCLHDRRRAGRRGRGNGTVEIAPQNDPPIAGDDEAFVLEESRTTVDVLANDADVDGDALVVRLVDPPRRGQASVGDGGRILYSSLKVSAGTDEFTYSVDDGNAEPVIATVTVTIFPPVLIDSIQVAEDTSAQPADQRPAFTVKLPRRDVGGRDRRLRGGGGLGDTRQGLRGLSGSTGRVRVRGRGVGCLCLRPTSSMRHRRRAQGVVHRRADSPLPGRAREPCERHGDDPHRRSGCGRRLGRPARGGSSGHARPGLGSAPC